MTAPAPVSPVQAAAPAVGLLPSAVRPQDGSDRWTLGLAWRAERCIAHQGFTPCGDVAGIDGDPDTEVAYYFPPAFRVRDYCTTIGGDLDSERVRRQVEAITDFVVARELWDGALSIAEPGTVAGAPYVNQHLASTDATTVVGTGTLAERLGQLEEAARVEAKGQQVFLHVPVRYITPLANLLRRVGTTLYTALDSIVVADAGYPGTGPDGTGTTWAYATGPVSVRLGPVGVLDAPRETIDRKINRQEIWGDRVFAATFDPCLHLAMNLAAA